MEEKFPYTYKREKQRFSIRKTKAWGACSVFLGTSILFLSAGTVARADTTADASTRAQVVEQKTEDNGVIVAVIGSEKVSIKELEKIKNEQYDFDEIELNYRWFRSVKNGFQKKYGYELTEDKFYEIDSAELAQELLNNGTVNAIEDLMKITFGNIMIGGNEDEQD